MSTRLWPYALVAVAGVAVLGIAGYGVAQVNSADDARPTGEAPWDAFDPSSQPAHTADADTPSTMFDSDTGVLVVGQNIQPGTYTATPSGGSEGFYSILTCWDDSPSCYGEAQYVTAPTAITVPRDAVGVSVAYLELGR